MSKSGISKRTMLTLVLGLAAAAIVYALGALAPWGDRGVSFSYNYGEGLIVAACGLLMFRAAADFPVGSPTRRQWRLMALGALSFAVGDLVWGVYEAVLQLDAFPSLADPFFIGSYVFIGAGIIIGALAYRRLIPMARPFALAAGATFVGGVLMYVAFLQSVVFGPSPVFERILTASYPVGDLLLEFGPAVFGALVVSRLGTGRLAWPTWGVVLGTVLIAVTDTVWAYADAMGSWSPGGWTNYGWSVGFVLLAVGASIARDVAVPLAAPQSEKVAEAA